MLNNGNYPLNRYRSLCDLRGQQQQQLSSPSSTSSLSYINQGSTQSFSKQKHHSSHTTLSHSLQAKRKVNVVTSNGNFSKNPGLPSGRLVSSTNTSSTGKGINRKRLLSCDNLNEINRSNSLSVTNLNCLNQTTSASITTLTGYNNSNGEVTNKRELSLEPCCLCCTPRTKLTKNNSTTNLRHQRNNRCNSNQKLDDCRKNLNCLKDDDESNQLERYLPSQELYKKLVKENLQLQGSFKVVCQRLEEEREKSINESKENQSLKDHVNQLIRKVDLLAMELQEARDQNELMEFKILESEQLKSSFVETAGLVKCDKAIQLEPLKGSRDNNLIMTANGSVGRSEKTKVDSISSNGTPSGDLFNYGLTGKRCIGNLDGLTGKSNKSCSSLESFALTLSLTSEDEGLGDDGRRDQFSGPSSLSDLQSSSDEESSDNTGSGSGSIKHREIGIQTSQVDVDLTLTGPCQYCKESGNLEAKVNLLIEERDALQEQVLELEEAENDARLVSQRLQRQVENLVNQVDCLQISLVKANQQIDQCNETIRSLKECELKLKVDFMMALIAKSEDSPSKLLDELKTKLKEKKNELAAMGPMVFSSLNTFDDRSNDQNGSSNRHNFQQAIHQQQQQANQSRIEFNHQAHQTYLQLCLNDEADDCEIFVPEDSLPPDPGSSFHVQMLNSSRFNNRRPLLLSSSSSTNSSTLTRSPLPLCETVKPKKIDLLLSSSSSSSSLYSSPSLSASSSPLVSPASPSNSSTSSSNLLPSSPLSSSPSSPPMLSASLLTSITPSARTVDQPN